MATDELKFGDNDDLAALICNLVGADLLVLLTDVTASSISPGNTPTLACCAGEAVTADIEAHGNAPANWEGRHGDQTTGR